MIANVMEGACQIFHKKLPANLFLALIYRNFLAPFVANAAPSINARLSVHGAIFFPDRICNNTVRVLIRSHSLHDLAVEMPVRMCEDR